MNSTDLLVIATFVLIGVAALPLGAFRRALLYLLYCSAHSALLAAVVACAVFAFHPEDAPAPLRELLATIAPTRYPGIAWLVKAALLVIFALPLLAHLEYAREIAINSAYLRALRRNGAILGAGGGSTSESDAGGLTRHPAAEVAAAVDAMRNAAGTARRASAGPRKLVKDTLAKNKF